MCIDYRCTCACAAGLQPGSGCRCAGRAASPQNCSLAHWTRASRFFTSSLTICLLLRLLFRRCPCLCVCLCVFSAQANEERGSTPIRTLLCRKCFQACATCALGIRPRRFQLLNSTECRLPPRFSLACPRHHTQFACKRHAAIDLHELPTECVAHAVYSRRRVDCGRGISDDPCFSPNADSPSASPPTSLLPRSVRGPLSLRWRSRARDRSPRTASSRFRTRSLRRRLRSSACHHRSSRTK